MPAVPPEPDHVRTLLDGGDVAGLTALLAADPAAARRPVTRWPDHPLGVDLLGYVAMLRYDTAHEVWRDVAGTADMARALLAAGAPVNGEPDDPESPLMTAASYGDAEVAGVLIEAGADLEATAGASAGGVPGGTALLHAAVFGMTTVVDVLVGAGARVPDLVLAAAAGDIAGWLQPDTRAGANPGVDHGRRPPAAAGDRRADRRRHTGGRRRHHLGPASAPYGGGQRSTGSSGPAARPRRRPGTA